jgi:hypothetical protein
MIWMELAQHLATAVNFELGFELSSAMTSSMMTSSLAAIGVWQDAGHSFVSQLGGDWSHLALLNTDVFAATRSFFDHFFKTGQAWALLIGIVLGYLLRGLTSYG